MSGNPKQRFSSRVENYVRYRPGYPRQVIDLLTEKCALSPQSQVADIGSGSGLLARRFLEAGCRVFGVEPNPEMRRAGEACLAGFERFTSLDGSAEDSRLPAHSVDMVTAGQAFHWFDAPRARAEFVRILRPGGWVALVWNERLVDSTPFLRAYEALLQRFATDYAQVNHVNVENDPRRLHDFFGAPPAEASFPNRQVFDLDGVRGRLLSSSYAPEAGHPHHRPMLDELTRIFERHQQDGVVAFEYRTRVHYGRLQRAASQPGQNYPFG